MTAHRRIGTGCSELDASWGVRMCANRVVGSARMSAGGHPISAINTRLIGCERHSQMSLNLRIEGSIPSRLTKFLASLGLFGHEELRPVAPPFGLANRHDSFAAH